MKIRTLGWILAVTLMVAGTLPVWADEYDNDLQAPVTEETVLEQILMQQEESLDHVTPNEPATQDTASPSNSSAETPPTTDIDPAKAEAQPSEEMAIVSGFESVFGALVDFVASILFYEVFGFPFIVLWLVAGGVFFTLRLGFVNIRMFGHAIQAVRGKYDNENDPGEVTHFQALSAAVSGTVGLGNIAGVAVAVAMGGPGAVVWMAIAGILGMSTKFAEVTLGHKYRQISEDGKVLGGAFRYLEHGLKEQNFPRLGTVLAITFAALCLAGSMGGGNMFQANQTVKMMTGTFTNLSDLDWVIALVMAVAVGTVLIGGIRRIASVAEAIVPTMAIIYMTAAITVLVVNAQGIPSALATMFSEALDIQAIFGGSLGAIIMGFRRAAFSNEAGIGSAPIAHAAAKTTEPVREGCVALLEPFIDTVVICFVTGLVITVTGVYTDEAVRDDGVLLTSAAFATVIDWFPTILAICISLFAFSTMITWSYYGERAWHYLFGPKTVSLYHILFCAATFFGGVINFGIVLDFSDLMLLSMAVPNLIGLYLLQGVVKREMDVYIKKLRSGDFNN